MCRWRVSSSAISSNTFGGGGIALGEVFGEGHVDAAVLLLGGDGHREDFAFGEFGEGLHVGAPARGADLRAQNLESLLNRVEAAFPAPYAAKAQLAGRLPRLHITAPEARYPCDSRQAIRRAMHLWFRLSRPMTLGVRGARAGRRGPASSSCGRPTRRAGCCRAAASRRARRWSRRCAARCCEEGNVEIRGEPELHGMFFNQRASRAATTWRCSSRARSRVLGPRPPDREIVAADFFPLDALPRRTRRAATRARIAEVFEGAPRGTLLVRARRAAAIAPAAPLRHRETPRLHTAFTAGASMTTGAAPVKRLPRRRFRARSAGAGPASAASLRPAADREARRARLRPRPLRAHRLSPARGRAARLRAVVRRARRHAAGRLQHHDAGDVRRRTSGRHDAARPAHRRAGLPLARHRRGARHALARRRARRGTEARRCSSATSPITAASASSACRSAA